MIALISYNPAPQYVKSLSDTYSLDILDCVFSHKDKSRIYNNDLQWQAIINQQKRYDGIVIFGGKARSGSLEILHLTCQTLPVEKIYFVLCSHNLHAKNTLLQSYHIKDKHIFSFSDSHQQCHEWPIMVDIALTILSQNQKL